jgi:hypothetical protein
VEQHDGWTCAADADVDFRAVGCDIPRLETSREGLHLRSGGQ